jgi:hypothetical protein
MTETIPIKKQIGLPPSWCITPNPHVYALASYLSESEAEAAGVAGHGLSLGTEQTAILLASIATAIRRRQRPSPAGDRHLAIGRPYVA